MTDLLNVLQRWSGDQAIPPELVNALMVADAEAKAAEENHRRLKDYIADLETFFLNVGNRPDLNHLAPVSPRKVVFVEMRKKDTTGHGGHPTEVYDFAFEDTDEFLGQAVPNYIPPPPPPAGIVKIGPIRIKSQGEFYYAALPGDTVEEDREVIHPQTGERLKKFFTPFGGKYKVI